MAKKSKSNNSNAAAEEYPEELKEDTAAALLISSFKYHIPDRETTIELENLKHKILGKFGAYPFPENEKKPKIGENYNGEDSNFAIPPTFLQELPPIGQTIDGKILPEIPPVQSLINNDVIGNCSKPFEKQLTASDLKDDQNRLSLNRDSVECALLPLLDKGEDLEKGIKVIVYDSEGREYNMVFKIWASKTYVLNGGWKNFYRMHALIPLVDWVTVWMFRHNQTEKLCFALTVRRLPTYVLLKKNARNRKA